MEDLIDELTNNSSDQDAMTAGVDVLYTVKFTQRAPKASESEAVKSEVGNGQPVPLASPCPAVPCPTAHSPPEAAPQEYPF